MVALRKYGGPAQAVRLAQYDIGSHRSMDELNALMAHRKVSLCECCAEFCCVRFAQ